MTCRLLLDTSVIVGAVLSSPVRYIVKGLGVECIVYYSALYTVVDVEGSKLGVSVKRRVLEWASENLVDAGYLTPAEESKVFGRYGKWVKRIKKMDVAIAYLAIARDYIFVTGDLEQFRFFESIYASRNPKSPLKAMFIPVRWLV